MSVCLLTLNGLLAQRGRLGVVSAEARGVHWAQRLAGQGAGVTAAVYFWLVCVGQRALVTVLIWRGRQNKHCEKTVKPR